MKQLLIVFLVSIFAVSMESCTPKAAIPSAARLSEKDYEKAIHKERRAREVRKTEALAKQNGYYVPKEQRSLNARQRKEIKAQRTKITALAVDSLLSGREFIFVSTAMHVNGKTYTTEYRVPPMRLVVEGNCMSSGLDSFNCWTYDLQFRIVSKTAKKTTIELKARNEREIYNIYLTVKSNGNAEVSATRLSADNYLNRKGYYTGFFVGYITGISSSR